MKLALTILPILAAASAHGASLLTLSNPVADGAINTAASNNVRSDWDGLTSYPADPNESLTPDFQTITIAHDSLQFYFRQVMHSSVGGYFSGNQILMFDTDQNRSTGYIGAAGTFSAGAEYMLQGNSLVSYTGSGTDWSWSLLAAASYDDFPTNDHEMSISRSSLGGATTFDFIAITDFWGGGDAYPDGGQSGSGGGYYTYTTIPEPGAAMLGGLGLWFMFSRRRNRHLS